MSFVQCVQSTNGQLMDCLYPFSSSPKNKNCQKIFIQVVNLFILLFMLNTHLIQGSKLPVVHLIPYKARTILPILVVLFYLFMKEYMNTS